MRLTSGAPRHKGNVLTEGRILTFKLGGEAQLPETQITYLNVPEPQKMDYTAEQRAEGSYSLLVTAQSVTVPAQVP